MDKAFFPESVSLFSFAIVSYLVNAAALEMFGRKSIPAHPHRLLAALFGALLAAILFGFAGHGLDIGQQISRSRVGLATLLVFFAAVGVLVSFGIGLLLGFIRKREQAVPADSCSSPGFELIFGFTLLIAIIISIFSHWFLRPILAPDYPDAKISIFFDLMWIAAALINIRYVSWPLTILFLMVGGMHLLYDFAGALCLGTKLIFPLMAIHVAISAISAMYVRRLYQVWRIHRDA